MIENEFNIAVLLPTRGRTNTLINSVISLINRAVIPEKIQLLFGVDNDDQVGLAYLKDTLEPYLIEKNVNYIVVSFEPMGYERLNEYVNSLANYASADWLFFWNDDAIMDSVGWDKIIADYTGQFKLLAVHTHNDHPYSIFPIVPSTWFNLFGYLSPHHLSDTWLSQQAYMLDIWERISVYVTHDRYDLTGNNNDDTYKNRVTKYEGSPENPKDFHHPSWGTLRINDTERLSIYMKSIGLNIDWWEAIKIGKQDAWIKLHENDINGQTKTWHVKK